MSQWTWKLLYAVWTHVAPTESSKASKLKQKTEEWNVMNVRKNILFPFTPFCLIRVLYTVRSLTLVKIIEGISLRYFNISLLKNPKEEFLFLCSFFTSVFFYYVHKKVHSPHLFFCLLSPLLPVLYQYLPMMHPSIILSACTQWCCRVYRGQSPVKIGWRQNINPG